MNKCFLQGYCGQDAEIKTFENGGKLAQFSLATTERGFKTKDGHDVPEKTTWHNVVVKSTGLATICERYVKKGSQLLIVGKIQNREYTDKNGIKRYVTEIDADELEFLGAKREQSSGAVDAYGESY